MGVSATLAGVELTLDPGGVMWALRGGVEPFQRTFFTTKKRAEEIYAGGNRGPMELVIRPGGYDEFRARNLTALALVPGDYNTLGIVVADARWRLSRQTVTREYNVRKNSGDVSLIGSTRLEIAQNNPDVVFKAFSLKDGRPWTPTEILDDVLGELFGAGNYVVSEGALKFSVPVENLFVDDNGGAALGRVLGYLPGASIYMHPDGRARVYSTIDGSEEDVVSRMRAPLVGSPVLRKVNRSSIRPKDVHVEFEREIELRLDYDEQDQSPSVTRTRGVPQPPRILQNVIPVTDPTVELRGETRGRGSWLLMEDWLASIAEKADGDALLTQPLILQYYFSGLQYLRMLLGNQFIAAGAMKGTDLLWWQRMNAVLKHWRRTFRIHPDWVDQIRTIRPYRAAIIDQENGIRAKAEAFADITIKPSVRGLLRGAATGDFAAFVVDGYAADLTDAEPIPADIEIVDEANGIFEVAFRTDLLGFGDQVAPGRIQGTAPQIAVFGAYSDAKETWEKTKIDPAWKLSVVLTVTPATPNDSRRFLRETVSITDALALLPSAKVGEAFGPDWYLRIGAGVETARYGWRDSLSTQIEDAVFNGADMPEELLVNGESIRAVALASAARVQSLLLDRYEGEQNVSWSPGILPTGSMAQVTHAIDPSGIAYTNVQLPPITAAPDIYSLLPDSVRKVLLRQVVQ